MCEERAIGNEERRAVTSRRQDRGREKGKMLPPLTVTLRHPYNTHLSIAYGTLHRRQPGGFMPLIILPRKESQETIRIDTNRRLRRLRVAFLISGWSVID